MTQILISDIQQLLLVEKKYKYQSGAATINRYKGNESATNCIIDWSLKSLFKQKCLTFDGS